MCETKGDPNLDGLCGGRFGRTDTPLSIREKVTGDSNAQQWFVAGMELYQVGNTIWWEYESEEWKQDEKLALMAALRKAGQLRGPEKPVHCLSPLK